MIGRSVAVRKLAAVEYPGVTFGMPERVLAVPLGAPCEL